MKRWVLLLLLPLVFVSYASAQVTTGLGITKTCPTTPVPPGSQFQCTFTIQNQDPVNTVINLAATNTVPFPGGTPVAIQCEFPAGTPVTTLQHFGASGDTCGGTITETAPPCDPAGTTLLTDQVAATGTDTNGGGTPLPVSASTTNTVQILACTPTNTPTSTPTNTPTVTTTVTATNTPTSSPTPVIVAQVPTMSEWGMLGFGLLLAGLGYVLLRKGSRGV